MAEGTPGYFSEEGAMNWTEVQDNWAAMCLLLRTQWPRLSDQDLDGVRGSREGLAGALARRYGFGPDDAERAICQFEKDVRFPGAVK
jgi:hypothetical protein